MNKLREIVKIYFQKVSSYNILQGNLTYDNFDEEHFKLLALRELLYMSETETADMYRYLQNRKCGKFHDESATNVFRALKESVSEYLLIRNDQPICKYDTILEWRELTRSVGEDVAICAFLARETENSGKEWQDFEWKPVICHDNMQLHQIMQRGISDNHFHMLGSAPTSKLIWIYLMNDLQNKNYLLALRQVDCRRRQTRNHYGVFYREETLERMRFQAALIRVYLFSYLKNMRESKWDKIEELKERQDDIQNILQGEWEYSLYYNEVQSYIDGLWLTNSLLHDDEVRDYANLGYQRHSINHEFEGERALMYHMFRGEICGHKIPVILQNWFYAYLVILIKCREELQQVNENVGFENFNQYDGRRRLFFKTRYENEKMIVHAVIGTLEGVNMQSLELRTGPSQTAVENRNWIRECDSYIKKNLPEEEKKKILSKIYYVFHFAKQKDQAQTENLWGNLECRHNAFRKRVESCANELIIFRERYREEAGRVRGIDACAQEIDCRPEVFGTAFRRLSQHVVPITSFGVVHQWKITYHVGEDWKDTVDGLRAIDEAILFLNMKNGDRLGHATVLGIDIKKWYRRKKNTIWISSQEYLDNIVWLYHKLIEFQVTGCEALKGKLLEQFDLYFKKIYQPYLEEDNYIYTIDTYYQSWKLRGDKPELYKTGEYVEPWYYMDRYWVNEEIPDGEEIRSGREIANLVYYYHYSRKVRKMGEQIITKEISDAYIKSVELVQKGMQGMVAEKGICVETNPSSNYMISTIQTYEEHPISKFYNIGLTQEEELLQNCPQIHESINTDDQGVFHTSLENEYALVGCAMEMAKDEDGNKKYKKQMVYDWLDRIREHGNQQSFLNQ